MFFLSWSMIHDTVHPMVWHWVTHDGDSVGNLGLRGRPFNQVRVFLNIRFSPWDAFSWIGFVGVDGFDLIIEDLVSARSDLGLVDVHGLGLYGV
jgi:hypothetical protein